MSLFVGPLKWYEVASGLLAAVESGLSESVARACVVPGAIAWDAGDCGMLAVSLAVASPSNDFPATETGSLGNCTPALEVAEFVIQVMRCAPGIGEAADQLGGLAPACEDLDASAQTTTRDAHEIMLAVIGYLNEIRSNVSIIDYVVGAVQTMGPEGGVVGNEMRCQVGLPYG